MPWSSEHIKWLVDTGQRLKTKDGKEVAVWEFLHQDDEAVLSAWAKHFRNHYCFDSEIDRLRGTYYSRTEYLNKIKFPHPKVKPGPSIRAGDFGEILVGDFLEYLMGYWVPRTRYSRKDIANESTKGIDIVGFHFEATGKISSKDILALFETKVQFSGRKAHARLQDAINDLKNVNVKKGETLNAIKQRLFDCNEFEAAQSVERFQDEVGHPYKEVFGAVAIFESALFDNKLISSADSSSHPYSNDLILIVIKGDEMMSLVHELYRRAADEA